MSKSHPILGFAVTGLCLANASKTYVVLNYTFIEMINSMACPLNSSRGRTEHSEGVHGEPGIIE